jgi:hypothetical protein
MWGKVVLTALLCLFTIGTHAMHRETITAIPKVRPDQGDGALLLPPTMTQIMALGHDSLMADFFWLYTIQYYGDQMLKERDPVHLYHYFDTLTTLDPDFEYAYIFASFVLSGTPEGRAQSIQLLNRGIRLNPQAWILPYQLGFVYYIFEKNNLAAAEQFAKASKLPNAASNAARLAAKLYEREGVDDCAITKDLWAEAAKSASDKDTAVRAQKYYIETTIRCDLLDLNRAVKTYISQQQTARKQAAAKVKPAPGASPPPVAVVRPPANPQTLVNAGVISGIPADPLRRAYRYDARSGQFKAETLPWQPYELKPEQFVR